MPCPRLSRTHLCPHDSPRNAHGCPRTRSPLRNHHAMHTAVPGHTHPSRLTTRAHGSPGHTPSRLTTPCAQLSQDTLTLHDSPHHVHGCPRTLSHPHNSPCYAHGCPRTWSQLTTQRVRLFQDTHAFTTHHTECTAIPEYTHTFTTHHTVHGCAGHTHTLMTHHATCMAVPGHTPHDSPLNARGCPRTHSHPHDSP